MYSHADFADDADFRSKICVYLWKLWDIKRVNQKICVICEICVTLQNVVSAPSTEQVAFRLNSVRNPKSKNVSDNSACSDEEYHMKNFWYSFSKFGVKTPLPMFSLISSLLQNLPPANSSRLGFTSPSYTHRCTYTSSFSL